MRNLFIAFALALLMLYSCKKTATPPTNGATVTTFAGNTNGTDYTFRNNVPALSANYYVPEEIVFDKAGNLFIADLDNFISKIGTDGIARLIAGNDPVGPVGGPGLSSNFFQPEGIAIDNAGNLYIADYFNNRIQKIGSDRTVSTYAGTGTNGYKDGPATSAEFSGPSGIVCDKSGDLFVSETFNGRIRKITPDGMVSTYAGDGTFQGGANGAATSSSFNFPTGLAIDDAGNLYVADKDNNKIRVITTNHTVADLAGTGQAGFNNGPGAKATFNHPYAVAVDAGGNVYVGDSDNNVIRKIAHNTRMVTTYAGTGQGGSTDGPALSASFHAPRGLAIDSKGNLYVCDCFNRLIRKISKE